ncbi:serine hydrolase [Streptomyces europaeiscabiei]|uniref:Serine hydrolase n=1 Tax=Streptomyces europaeiscabiei TaxID=146819 RepID=A0ABU4NAC4_9ACTN|nr:serine hydrolase [Streptomyces europaeiscabiei]MDX2762315.1 serine hydrolase [Streptomyces europaeiscabiei]MDX2772016.1 serine hydrolase [Streptomyces europaeiscabiei]MDX3541443.1 serine hydrolase [Streptomyces europaeiscabiei]MDX3551784.1 serine hydrolase [Streptomyces europaeiscabiei]MDX3669047.1 serine hydrolase [Streptomyces europaeiscabiei]
MIVTSAATAFAPAAAAAPTPQVTCTSKQAGLAEKLQKDITAALAKRKGTVAVGLYDRVTDTTCTLRGDTAFDSASVVKVTVLAALLYDAKKKNRYLTDRETKLATAMITKSDNDSTSTLWRQLGLTKIKAFLTAAKMTQTKPGANNYWGLTQITVRDEQRLLALLTAKNSVLSDNARAYVLKLMNKVVAGQRWGTPAGAPSTVKVHVKNGWLSRATHGWRVHSVGTFVGGGRDYTITVLTHGNPDMQYGVNTIQGVAKAIHKDLVPVAKNASGTPSVERYVPTDRPQEATVPVPEAGTGSG